MFEMNDMMWTNLIIELLGNNACACWDILARATDSMADGFVFSTLSLPLFSSLETSFSCFMHPSPHILLHSLDTMSWLLMCIVNFVLAATILLTITEHLSFLSPAICCGKFHQLKAADNIPPVGIRNLHGVAVHGDYINRCAIQEHHIVNSVCSCSCNLNISIWSLTYLKNRLHNKDHLSFRNINTHGHIVLCFELSLWIIFTLSGHKTYLRCRIIKVYLLRCLFYKHDFLNYILTNDDWSNRYRHYKSEGHEQKSILFSLLETLTDMHDATWMPQSDTIHYFDLETYPCVDVENDKCLVNNVQSTLVLGGGRVKAAKFPGNQFEQYLLQNKRIDNTVLEFVIYLPLDQAEKMAKASSNYVLANVPIYVLADVLTISELKDIARIHGIWFPTRFNRTQKINAIKQHVECPACKMHASIFFCTVQEISDDNKKAINRCYQQKSRQNKKDVSKIENDFFNPSKFPPPPASAQLQQQIASDFCEDTSPASFEEAGCAVCGKLVVLSKLKLLKDAECDLTILHSSDVTRKQRKTNGDSIQEIEGPVLDTTCDHICDTCRYTLNKGKRPLNSLANGLWIGEIPVQLQNLTFAERILVARVRHNRCLVRVSSGRAKMIANAIMFSNPTLKVYQKLPPSREELDDVLAFIFTGIAQPTEDDFKRTPMLVRRNKVASALEWLKLNHIDYSDLEISEENLQSYPLEGVPVVVDYKRTSTDSNKLSSAMSLHDNEDEEGTIEGLCPFTVHGLTGTEFETFSMQALKAKALQHLDSEGKTLAIGHSDSPESLYDNPQAYPQMFPWLFPYGLGGIGQARHKGKFSEMLHKRHLLMYHDKRFQTDIYFPIIAFNHDQMKSGITGSFLLTKRQNFTEISQRLMNINSSVLKHISQQMAAGENVKPQSDEEKLCFSLIDDLDHVGGHVKGSLTSKKYMRNEIWSLISFMGAPSWFITFSPVDSRHPIALYYADKGIYFKPEIRCSDERNRLVAQNPVAAARFFDFMVKMFIKHVLGVDKSQDGLYGKTSAYYGTVEQQGRLTLHMHMLLWIDGALSPQEIRNKLMNSDEKFQNELVAYLEGSHVGEFLTGSIDEVKAKVSTDRSERKGIHAIIVEPSEKPVIAFDYRNPTLTLPEKPPNKCIQVQCMALVIGVWL